MSKREAIRVSFAIVGGSTLQALLDNADAARDQAAANLKVARANLEQSRFELADAERAFRRSAELLR